MKRVILATAMLFGALGTANAGPITTLTNMIIWSANTGGVQTGTDQLALPFNPIKTAANVVATGAAGGGINFNLPGPSLGATSMIGDFLATDSPALSPNPCTGTCLTTTLSTLGFTHGTLFELTFTAPGAPGDTVAFSVTHDDGAALFLAGTEGSCTSTAACSTDLFNVADASPTFSMTSGPIDLMPGQTYDLWYMSANGDPEVLTSNFVDTPPVGTPEPGTLALLGSALVAFGWLGQRRRKDG